MMRDAEQWTVRFDAEGPHFDVLCAGRLNPGDEYHVARVPNRCDAHLIAAAPRTLNMLQRLVEKVATANSIQHSGGRVEPEDWADLYVLANEANGIIEEAKSGYE